MGLIEGQIAHVMKWYSDKCLGYARGGEVGGLGCVGSLGIDWYITDKYKN